MIFIFLITLLQGFPKIQGQCHSGSCNPQLGDLMVGRAAQLSASSTCGLHGPQGYCIIGYLEKEQKCFTCDSRMPFDHFKDPNSHCIDNIITSFDHDPKLRWWQSENGVDKVSIQLDLETLFQFSHLVLTFKSFRPAAMLVERSKDFGQTWKIFRYFSDNCLLDFPWVSHKAAASVNDIVCDSRYSGPEPSTNGEVVLKALDPIFEIQNLNTPNIQDLITLTNLRVNFTRLFTLGDTLLSQRRRNPQDKYYYALYNMVVQGSCFCNGHAEYCGPADSSQENVSIQTGMVHSRCVCQHNTAGANCEQCKGFYHDSPWRSGEANPASICQKCNCHGHSDSCHFDPARFEMTGGVSGGVCDNCQHNRTGPQCEACRPFLFQDPHREIDDPRICIPCDCDPAGSQADGLCDALTGQCVCKPNVEGRRCDRCKHGFFSLSHVNPAGCQVCRCHVVGSLGSCDQVTGSCECDRYAVGPLCDQCQAGFWGLGNSVYRCSPCSCDVGGANSIKCSQEDGQCHCLPNMIGRRCSDPAPGYFLPFTDYFLYEAELAAPLHQQSSSSWTTSSLMNMGDLPRCKKYFRDKGFDFRLKNGQIVLVPWTRRLTRQQKQETSIPLNLGQAVEIVARQRTSSQLITWTGLGLVRVFEGTGLRFTVDNLPISMEFQLVINYESEPSSDWLSSVNIATLLPGDGICSSDPMGTKTLVLPKNTRLAALDSTVCLNAGGRYFVDVIFSKTSRSDASHLLIDSMGLIPRSKSVQDFCSQSNIDSVHPFDCIGLAEQDQQQSLPEICEGLIKRMSALVHKGALRCRCNVIGSLSQSCSKLGGFCKCKLNVIGHCCDTCAPLTFGFGPFGCKSCECDPQGSLSDQCDQVQGQCACRANVMGQHCNRCKNGFWGFPFCQPCECNGLSEICQEETGECMNCRDHTTGPHCDRCVDGYYRSPVSGAPCLPCLCPDAKNTGRFFATSCQHDPESLSLMCICRKGHTGPHCNSCMPGFYSNLMTAENFCKQCPCNSNINPDDHDACDALTGECLRCLYNTMGTHCQQCKPGYYGNALNQDCKECACDRRGTEVIQCPIGSPCFCDQRTGQCPCRTGVVGVFCDECQDGYWNMDGVFGCQPCSCDSGNSLTNVCNKVTGQCPCRSEFGGIQCDECAENHFGNPHLQCISCDCNLNGSEGPSCDSKTGECICRTGVTGLFCDECAPGYISDFPACEACHPCTSLWAMHVTDVQGATQKMKTLIPYHSKKLPSHDYRQQMLIMYSELKGLSDLTELSQPTVEKLQKLCVKIRRLTDVTDTNLIVMDLSPVLNTEIDNIHLDFKKLINNPNKKVIQDLAQKEDPEDLMDQIWKSRNDFGLDEERLRNVNKVLDNSMDNRQNVKHILSMCSSRGHLASLENDTSALSRVNLNKQICGGPVLKDCSRCGEDLCKLDPKQKYCGKPNCNGVLNISRKLSERADTVKGKLDSLLSSIKESSNKLTDAQQVAEDTKYQAKVLHDRKNKHMNVFILEKNATWELTEQAKAHLIEEMVPAEDIQKVVQAVLTIELAPSPDQIQSEINNIYSLLFNTTIVYDDLETLEAPTNTTQSLLQEAQQLKEQIKDTDLQKLSGNIKEAKVAQQKANKDLESASRDAKTQKDRVHEIKYKLKNMETKLINHQHEELQISIEDLIEGTEQNGEMMKNMRGSAESALFSAAGSYADLDHVMKQFEVLKQKKWNQTFQSEAAERLIKTLDEVENLKTQVDDQLHQILSLEQRILELITLKQQKSTEVLYLLETADTLHQEISRRAKRNAGCAS